MTDVRLKEYLSLEVCTMDFLLLDTGLLDESQELATAVRVALGTDALSDPEEIVPDPDSTDRRGWWADMDAQEIWDGWPIGCKNWLLTRAKISDAVSQEGSTLYRAKVYTQEALQPFLDRAVATETTVVATRSDIDRIDVLAKIFRGPTSEIDLRYQILWEDEPDPEAPPPKVLPVIPRWLAFAITTHNSFLGSPALIIIGLVNLPSLSFATSSAVLGTPALVRSDPVFASVVLLVGFEGSNGATTGPGFTDESSKLHGTATVVGNGQISTAQFPFGTSSYLGDGTGDGCNFPDSADWKLSSANSDQFTVECKFRPASTTVLDKRIMGQGTTVGSLGWTFATTNTGSGELVFTGAINGSTFWSANPASSGLTWTAGQWYTLASDKDASGVVRVYRDGAMIATATPTSSVINDSAATLTIGCDNTAARSVAGNIKEIRITKGLARYANDGGYTVATSPFPRS